MSFLNIVFTKCVKKNMLLLLTFFLYNIVDMVQAPYIPYFPYCSVFSIPYYNFDYKLLLLSKSSFPFIFTTFLVCIMVLAENIITVTIMLFQ
jgi:hypothetical protein